MSDQNKNNLGLFVVDKKCKFIKITDLAPSCQKCSANLNLFK